MCGCKLVGFKLPGKFVPTTAEGDIVIEFTGCTIKGDAAVGEDVPSSGVIKVIGFDPIAPSVG